jgi:hypothetical protein
VVGAAALMALAQNCAWGFQANTAATASANPEDENFPVTVNAAPSTLLSGNSVVLTGTTLPLLNSDVMITIAAPKATPPQFAKLPAIRNADGSFHLTYAPKVAGAYTVTALAPDGKGHAATTFTVENPSQMTSATAQALNDLVQDSNDLGRTVRQKLANLPPSPARDQAEQKLDGLTQKLTQLTAPTKDVSSDMKGMIGYTAGLTPNTQVATDTTVAQTYSVGGGGTVAGHMSATLSRTASEREGLVEKLGQASQIHERTKEELKKLKTEQAVCDNLEVVSEGIKWVGVILNFMDGIGKLHISFAQDFASDAVGNWVKSHTGSPTAGFLAGEVPKNLDTLSREGPAHAQTWEVDLNNATSDANDAVGFLVDRVMDAYCEQFTGPVTAHMHAIFNKNGMTWWEYSFDVRAQLTLHYPKDASGSSVPLKGRIEGFGTNYKLWENALTVMYPELMSSTVQKRLYILPVAPADTQTGLIKKITSVEGSVLGQITTPNNFFMEIHGAASEDQLDIQIGPASADTDSKARVIVLYLPVLTPVPGLKTFTLPYKPIHFVFERAATTYSIPLTTDKKVIRGKQHFENKKGTAEAMGDYTVDIQACNPDC